MIIWSGWGFMVAVLVFALSLTTELGVEAYFGDDRYYQTQAWPLAAALLVAGGVTWVWGSRLNRVPGRTVIDKQTGREEVIGGPGGIVLLRADAVRSWRWSRW